MATFNSPTDVTAGSRAKSSDLNTLDAAVAAAFALLPTNARINTGTVTYAVDTGTANACLVALPTTATGYTDGMSVTMKPLNNNTGPSTINVDSLGVKSIKTTLGEDPSANEIVAGIPLELRYSTTLGYFCMVQSSTASAATAAISAAAASGSASAASSSASAALGSANAAAASAVSAAASAAAAPAAIAAHATDASAHHSSTSNSLAITPLTVNGLTISSSGSPTLTVTGSTTLAGAASATVAGPIEIATNAETTTGTATTLAVTPDDLSYLFARPFAMGETTPNTVRKKFKTVYRTANAGGALSVAECSGTILSNYGMTDADCLIELPTAEEGLHFICVLPTVRARYFRLKAVGSDTITLNGTAGSGAGYVGVASGYATKTRCNFYTVKSSDGGWDWCADPVFGTWVAG